MKQLSCKRFKKLIVDALYNYDQLLEEEKQLFHAHLSICPGCAVEYEEMAVILGVMDQRQAPEMGEEFWNSYYLRLQEKMEKSREIEKNNIWLWLKKRWVNFSCMRCKRNKGAGGNL